KAGPRNSLAARSPRAQPPYRFGKRDGLPCIDLALAERQDLQEGKRLLHRLVRRDVLHHRAGLAVLRDHEGLARFRQLANKVRGVGFAIADRLDARRLHETEFSPLSVHVQARKKRRGVALVTGNLAFTLRAVPTARVVHTYK